MGLSMMTSSDGSIFRVTGPLCREFTGHWWIPRIKASDAVLWCFLWSALWINGWVSNHEAGDLKHHWTHYDIIVMIERTTSSTMFSGQCVLCPIFHWHWCHITGHVPATLGIIDLYFHYKVAVILESHFNIIIQIYTCSHYVTGCLSSPPPCSARRGGQSTTLGQSTWLPLLELLFWFPVLLFKCFYIFENEGLEDFIYQHWILKWVAVAWKHDTLPE